MSRDHPLLARVPLPVLLTAILSASMYVPAIHASVRSAHHEAQAFFYSGTLLLALCAALAVATMRDAPRHVTRGHLIALLFAFTVLPAFAAIPLAQITSDTRPLNAYVEMVAAMTTTGGSLFAPDRLSETAHLWRAMVAWEGGALIWVAAIAILAPLDLGGFEVTEGNEDGHGVDRGEPEARLARATLSLVPLYVALTVTLWGLIAIAGGNATTALIHAMSTLSTSGISDGTGLAGSPAGIGGELAIALFLILALSRQTFASDMTRDHIRHLATDRELWIGGAIIGSVSLALFARHWLGAYQVGAAGDPVAALGALWGSIFTTLSFLTTTGFESAHWQAAREWSGLAAPAVLLLGLAMFGGGVATTAGGVKLLRIYTLYTHGRREMNLLVHPHALAGARRAGPRIPKRGVESAWVFFMLFATSIAVLTLALTATGLDFQGAMALGIACLTNTGPLAENVLGGQFALNGLSDAAKLVAGMAMVIGRLEALAIIALLNPEFWRD